MEMTEQTQARHHQRRASGHVTNMIGTKLNGSYNFTDDGNGYGDYGAYFDRDVLYDKYGGGGGKFGPGGKWADSSQFGPGGPNTSIDEAAENALLGCAGSMALIPLALGIGFPSWPGDVPSHDSLKDLFNDKWKAWMKDYYRKKELEKAESGILTSEERNERNDPFWPKQLIGFGHGDSGDPPPPYAYMPGYVPVNDEGFPTLCFLPIQKGSYHGVNCSPGPRYAFVAGIKICSAFYFRGCGENQNNFKTKQSCEDVCTKAPEAGCAPDTMQDLERIAYEYGLV